jgi:hypothetical protein
VKEVDIFEYEAEERHHPLFDLLPSAGLTDTTLKGVTVAGEILYWIYKLLEGERERERDDSWWGRGCVMATNYELFRKRKVES